MKTSKFPILFFLLFGLIGFILLFAGFSWLSSSLRFKERAVEITGEIVEIYTFTDSDGDTHHSVYVDYYFNGTAYEGVSINYYSSGMYEGKEVTLLCDPDDPGHIRSNGSLVWGSIFLLGLGLLFFLVGLIPLIISIKNEIKRKNLLNTGQTLYATVDDIVCNVNYSMNGKHPYLVYCSYYDQYKDATYRFKSDNIWTDPGLVLRTGSNIEVLVNPNDYSKYHVNVEDAIAGKLIDYT